MGDCEFGRFIADLLPATPWPEFTEIPALEIQRPEFIEMIDGDNAILADVFQFSPELLEDIALIFTRASQDSVKIAMNLESESCGEKIIEFLAGSTPHIFIKVST